jgi:hypothetical protein
MAETATAMPLGDVHELVVFSVAGLSRKAPIGEIIRLEGRRRMRSTKRDTGGDLKYPTSFGSGRGDDGARQRRSAAEEGDEQVMG